MQHKLDDKIRALLDKHRGNWLEIAKESGVSHSWISKFIGGHIHNPGYETLCKLQNYLATKKVKK